MVISNVVIVVRGPLEITEIGSIRECLCVYPYIFFIALPGLFIGYFDFSLSLSYISHPIRSHHYLFPGDYICFVTYNLLFLTCCFCDMDTILYGSYSVDGIGIGIGIGIE